MRELGRASSTTILGTLDGDFKLGLNGSSIDVRVLRLPSVKFDLDQVREDIDGRGLLSFSMTGSAFGEEVAGL
jgi:hypothetical protein